MKKNLKKVISAVLALTLALSSFVALNVSAATFADVADTANYAEAVNALSALGAISGYEDGTFLPNNNITRAEVTTMVVAALNLTADAQNSGSTTQFADVNANAAWAAGYVNVGVAQGFISGMSATEFAPSENVTYAQVLSMLTRILGYGDFAAARGGWPNGYLTAASTAGILSGVSAGANDAVTRAQVAQLIWNTLQAPMLDITTFSTSSTGTEMQKMDGKDGRDFRTVLSDKFDAYVLNVTVDATSKSDDTLEAGDIKMTLTNSNDWDPSEEVLVKDVKVDSNLTKKDVAAGATDAESYLFSSAKVVAEYNDDDEWTLLYFAPTSKVTMKTVDGTLVADNHTTGTDDSKDGVTADYLRIKKSNTSSTTTNYKLTDGTNKTTKAALYVNGVFYCDVDGNENKVQSILAESTGDTTLVESTVKSGYYDRIMCDYYVTARVSQVTTKSGSTKVSLASVKDAVNTGKVGTSFTIEDDDVESGDKTIVVTKAGAAAEVSALAKDDVVSIAFDINKKLDDSKTIEVIASTDSVTGKYTSYDDEDEVYAIGGNTYEAVFAYNDKNFDIGSTYTFKLDAFGRLFSWDEEATSKNYAIVERYINVTDNASANYQSSSSSEYSYIQVMTLDGQSKTLYIDSNYETKADTELTKLRNATSGVIATSVKATAKAVDIEDRIIEYSVKTSTGRINELSWVTGDDIYSTAGTATAYKASANRLGKNLTSTATVIDATNYEKNDAKTSDYKLSSLSALTDNVEYEAVLVYKNSDAEYAYVIVTSAGATYGESSDFVVVAADAKTASQGTYNDEEVYTIDVMQNGADEADKLYVSKSVEVYVNGTKKADYASAVSSLKQGAVFYYTKDSDDLVDEINVVLAGGYDWTDLTTLTNMATLVMLPDGSDAKMYDANDWGIDLDEKATVFAKADPSIQLVLAPVVRESGSTVALAPVKVSGSDYYIDTLADQSYSVKSDAKIYAYDMSGDVTGKGALSGGSFAAIDTKDADANGQAWFGKTGEYDFTDNVQFAFMMIVDGVVTNALVMNN